MPNSEEKIGTPRIEDLPGSYDMDHIIRVVLADAMKRCPKKRKQIADEMSHLLGRPVTEAMLNDYTSESHKVRRFPAAWAPAFCRVTSDSRVMQILADRSGLAIVGEEELQLMELGRATLAFRKAEQKLGIAQHKFEGGQR
jgi:hypothetical protein